MPRHIVTLTEEERQELQCIAWEESAGKSGSSVVCVGFKIGIWQHMPRRGISPSWLSECTGAQGCQGRHGRGVACALTALRHSAAFHPLLCIAHNAGNCCYGWSSPNLSPTHSTEEPNFLYIQ